ncbi:unnamed protein product [Lathyrus oleraceus]
MLPLCYRSQYDSLLPGLATADALAHSSCCKLGSTVRPDNFIDPAVFSRFLCCFNHCNIIYNSKKTTGSAAITRVSNALRTGHPQAARLSVYAAMTPAVSEAILISFTIFSSRRIVGYIFSDEQDILVNQNGRTNSVCCPSRMGV